MTINTNGDKLEGNLAFDGGRGIGHKEGRVGDWMQTFSGQRFFPADPRTTELDMASIVQSISTKYRYNGHCLPYSVAEHSVLISKVVKPKYPETIARFGAHDVDLTLAKYGLVHDAVECVISDMIRPLKRVLGKENDYFKIEALVEAQAVYPFFGLEPQVPKEVIELDTAICVLEKRVLHPRSSDWNLSGFEEPLATIQGLEWFEAAEAWLQRYGELWGREAAVAAHRQWFTYVSADMERLRAHNEEHTADRAIASPWTFGEPRPRKA